MGDELLQIVYVSREASALGSEQLSHIVESSRRNNLRCCVTGLLIRQGQTFHGVLEGEVSEVLARMEIIITDRRHRDVRIIRESWVSQRRFENWSFGDLPDSWAGFSPSYASEYFIRDFSRRLEHQL